MATVTELVLSGALIELVAVLGPDEQKWRHIHISPRLQAWMATTLPSLKTQLGLDLTPQEQLADLTDAFISGETLVYPVQFHAIRYVKDGVWELKTDDIRMFGWFNIKDSFIGAVANSAFDVKAHKLYDGHAGEVVRFREKLDLDEPKYIGGSNPHDVVSDFRFS